MAKEGSERKQAEATSGSGSGQGGSLFNDASSSDVVVRIVEGSEDGVKLENGGSLELHLHRHILVGNSSFFSAQLSDRWEDACARDAIGRPVLVITYCGRPQDCATALRKLYERAPGDPNKCPVHSFAGFEEALRCLKPADQLCLSSVWRSAVAHLESIPWSNEQREQLLRAMANLGLSSAELLKRMKPPSERFSNGLLSSVLSDATSIHAPNASAQAFVQDLMSEVQVSTGTYDTIATDIQAFMAAGLRRCLFLVESTVTAQLKFKAVYSSTHYLEIPRSILDTPMTNLLSNLAWMFQLPRACESNDVRRDITKTMLLIQAAYNPLIYKKHIFHRYIAERLYRPVLKSVAEGNLVLGAERRVSLLRMWVPSRYAYYAEEGVQHVHSEAMQAAFSAVLGSVSYEDQEKVMQRWVDELKEVNPWEPWFRDWMKRCLLARRKVESAGTESESS